MEPHPVPQNIIDVEFKLFGSFTLRQFSKILLGCLAGVALFFLNINPLIKLPLVFIAVITGIGLAIIPNLRVWLVGFLKAVFISPRYVWVKQPSTPELLQPKVVEKKPQTSKELQASISKKKLDIDELPLDVRYDFDDSNKDGGTNALFLKAYEDVYGQNTVRSVTPYQTLAKDSQVQPAQSKGGFASQFLSKAVQSIDINLIKPKTKLLKTRDDYLAELERLKGELDALDRTLPKHKEREKEIVTKMNDVYNEFKVKVGIDSPAVLQPNVTQTVASHSGKVINGIVVTKNDAPITDAEIYLTNLFFNKTYKIKTLQNGRFSTNIPIPQGEYDVKIVKEGLKFHNYKIKITDQKPPAFKFREK